MHREWPQRQVIAFGAHVMRRGDKTARASNTPAIENSLIPLSILPGCTGARPTSPAQ
jgi:hypothetical protein